MSDPHLELILTTNPSSLSASENAEIREIREETRFSLLSGYTSSRWIRQILEPIEIVHFRKSVGTES